jgi:hypothetical protein
MRERSNIGGAAARPGGRGDGRVGLVGLGRQCASRDR